MCDRLLELIALQSPGLRDAKWFVAGVVVSLAAPVSLYYARQLWKGTQRLLEGPLRREIQQEKRRRLEEELTKAELYSASLSDADADRIARCETIAELKAIQRGPHRVTAQAILKWYLKRAIIAHRTTNCLCEMNLEEAVVAAAAVDAAYEQSGQQLPLHGIPITVKDSVGVLGMDSTLGLFRNCFQPQKDSPVVGLLRRSGAIIIAKTNIPQTLISFECHNYVFGAATNPFNQQHTCGGSSGGEGAVLALRGSVVGIGTDIGGSIRIPSHFCGVFGLKPSQYRVAMRNSRAGIPGQEALGAVAGPMARTVEDLVETFRAICNGELWREDGLTHAIPFREALYQEGRSKRLRLGYYVDDGVLPTSPACTRAVQLSVAALRSAGHEVIPISVDGLKALSTYYGLITADGAETVLHTVGTDPLNPNLSALCRALVTPQWLKRIVAWGIARRDKVLSKLYMRLRGISVADYWKLHVVRNECRHGYVDALREEHLDAIICPGLAIPAPRLGGTVKIPFAFIGTGYFNLTDASVVTVPVTRVDKAIDAWQEPTPLELKRVPNPVMHRLLRQQYSADEMHGLPVGVQVATHRMSEEFALGVAEQLAAALKHAAAQ